MMFDPPKNIHDVALKTVILDDIPMNNFIYRVFSQFAIAMFEDTWGYMTFILGGGSPKLKCHPPGIQTIHGSFLSTWHF